MLSGEAAAKRVQELGVQYKRIGELEDMDSRLLEKALAFLKRRREGDSLEPLRVITGNPNYKTNEMAWKDRFLDPYMGKYYQGRHTEILSMGVEYLCKYPEELAHRDPEYFAFVYDLLRGR